MQCDEGFKAEKWQVLSIFLAFQVSFDSVVTGKLRHVNLTSHERKPAKRERSDKLFSFTLNFSIVIMVLS